MRSNYLTLVCLLLFCTLITQTTSAQHAGLRSGHGGQRPAKRPSLRTHLAGPHGFSRTHTKIPKLSTTTTPPSTTTSHTHKASVTSTTHNQKPSKTITSITNVPTLNSNATYHAASGALPIQPQITPAFGLAGAALIISGLAYTAIGFRHRGLSTFLSTAYLVALSVTVLIIYVVNPPTSEGIQVAYFFAAFLSGCIAGGLSIIFSEVTQSLGCLLGGFCLSMWILQLRSGGLITSVAGRVSLIAALSAGTFVFSFSKYTREYALMVCTAFAGATATLLGIDCFACFGMKEFWVYIWDLNKKIFPLKTNTYPLTRNIKVEIAAIVALALFGFLSQLKLYIIIKKKRKKTADARAQADEDREHLEADVGRKVEDINSRERVQWEMTYGADSISGSTVTLNSTLGYANSTKGLGKSESVNVEMKEMASSKRNSQSSSHTVTESKIEGPNNIIRSMSKDSPMGSPKPHSKGRQQGQARSTVPSSRASRNATPIASSKTSMETPRHPRRGESLQPSVPPPPPVVPLPFAVPSVEAQDKSDVISIATMGETVMGPVDMAVPAPKRRSLRRGVPKLAGTSRRGNPFDGSSTEGSDSEEEIAGVPHFDDDGSSVAATLDELDAEPKMSRLPSPPPTKRKARERGEERKTRKTESASNLRLSVLSQASSDADVSRKRRSSAPTLPEMQDEIARAIERQTALEPAKALGLKTLPSEKRRSGTSSSAGKQSRKSMLSVFSSDNPALPDLLPHYAIQYRTNEWAKHLQAAEKPDLDELDPTSAGVSIQYGEEEAPAPVDVRELQQTNTTTRLNAAPKMTPPLNSGDAPKASKIGPVLSNAAQPSQQATVPPARSNSSQLGNVKPSAARYAPKQADRLATTQLVRSSSQPVVATQGLRSTATPMVGQTFVACPVDATAQFPFATQMPMAMTGVQTQLPRPNDFPPRHATAATPSGHPIVPGFAPAPIPTYAHANPLSRTMSDTASVRSLPGTEIDSDNVSLASRRRQLVGKAIDDDNVSLSSRRQMLQNGAGDSSPNLAQHQQFLQANQMYSQQYPTGFLQPGLQPQATWPLPAGPMALGAPAGAFQAAGQPLFDSHQPHRGLRVDPYVQQAKLANWRESVRQDLVGGATQQLRAAADERRRHAMLQERRQVQLEAQQREWQASARDIAFDERMRNGEMLDLHRVALKKMQGNANKDG